MKLNLFMLRNLALVSFAILPGFIFSPSGDVLESHRFISPDGLDWIVEGRVLGSENLILPILRNVGFVLSSQLDWILGGHGIVFAAVNIAGLLLQGFSLIAILQYLNIRTSDQILGILIYFTSWIHFSSLYILPDTFAVGCLLFGAVSIAVAPDCSKRRFLLSLITLTLGSLFQFYVYAGFLFVILLLIKSINNSYMKVWRIILASSCMILSISITLSWRRVIPHLDVPTQFNYLKMNLRMISFYFNVWTLAFATLIALIIGFARKNYISALLKINVFKFLTLCSLALLALALFYQWPESRIAYSGISFSLITLISVLLYFPSFTDQSVKSKNKENSINRRALIVMSIILSLFIVPKDYWNPKLSETRPFYTWSIIAVYELISHQPSNYQDISKSIKSECRNPSKDFFHQDSDTLSNFSPYERTILTTYIRHFKCL